MVDYRRNSLMTPASFGYIRLLTDSEFWWYFESSPESRAQDNLEPAGMIWLPTRLGLAAEARRGSLEHQMLTAPWYFTAHSNPGNWPDSALFVFAETLFLDGQHVDFTTLMHARPAVADLLLGAIVRWHTNPCRVTRAQDLIRVAYAAREARAALKEIKL